MIDLKDGMRAFAYNRASGNLSLDVWRIPKV